MPRRRPKTSVKALKYSQAKFSQNKYEYYIVVLFADIVGCSEISNNKKLEDYNNFLSDFQDCFKKVCKHYRTEKYDETEYPFFQADARGDEGCLKIFVSKDDDFLARDIDTAIQIAFDLKRLWFFTKNNKGRILMDGLLPVDIGIGIHVGKVYVNKEKDDEGNNRYRPEGYVINLAKRVESSSREGKFTNIIISEAARGQLHNLKDEDTYKFNTPFSITPKGISRNIKVFEIKHHFLRTLWEDAPSESTILYSDIDNEKLEILKSAYNANPTNLWLAEEYILFSIIQAFKEDDSKYLHEALEVSRRIANGDLRDAGTLAIWGSIEGDLGEYKNELDRYDEASKLNPQDGTIHWYKALAISYQMLEESEGKDLTTFYEKNKEKIGKILDELQKAHELRPFNPWIVFDCACELSQWSQVAPNFRKAAIDNLIRSFGLNPDTKDRAKLEDYLKPIIDDSKIKRFLSDE